MNLKSLASPAALVCCFILSLAATLADDSGILTVSVPKGDKVLIRVPPPWQRVLIQPTPDLPPTIKISGGTNSLSLQITFLPDPGARFRTRESVDRAVTEANQHYVAGSVEKRLTLTQIVSTNGHGCYACFTDADLAALPNPPKGEFRNVASGLFVIGKQIASFTLLTNDPKSVEYQQALRIISDGISVP
jgi:hypothetical protein